MSHRYKLKDLVRLTRSGPQAGPANPGDVFEVIRLMPLDASGEATYRIKRTGGDAAGARAGTPGEHAVRESEITNRLTAAHRG